MITRFKNPWRYSESQHRVYLEETVEKNLAKFCKTNLLCDRLIRYFISAAWQYISTVSPRKCKKSIKLFNTIFDSASKYRSISQKLKKEALNKLTLIFDYATFNDKKRYLKGDWCSYSIYLQCTAKICPYCNIVDIECTPPQSGNEEKSYRGDIDHYYPKSEFPYLALTLGNFIPSCTICNGPMFKGVANTTKKPILNPLHDSENITFKLKIKRNGSIESIDIKGIKNKNNKTRNSIKMFGIAQRYNKNAAHKIAKNYLNSVLLSKDVKFMQQMTGQMPALSAHISIMPLDYKNTPYGKLQLAIFNQFYYTA